MSRYSPLLVLLIGTLVLGGLFLSTVPPGYGPDEPSHFGYVRHLAEGRGLPVLGRDRDPSGPSYESHQPPLYYALAVPAYALGKNVSGESGAWIAVRFFSLLCGLWTVVFVYLLALRLFPDAPEIAAGAGAFAGWLPSQVALFTVVNNDPLTELGFALTFYLLARYLLSELKGKWDALWIGVAAGLTMLAKLSALVLFPVLLGVFLVFSSLKHESESSPKLRPLILLSLGFAVCVPLLIRNNQEYGDPLGWKVFVDYFRTELSSPTPLTLAQRMRVPYSPAWYWWDAVGGWAARDSLGMWLFSRPGQPVPLKVTLPDSLYSLWWLLWAGAGAGIAGFSFREGRGKPREWKLVAGALLATLLLLLAAYLRLNAVFYWAHSRYLFPAISALALLWSVGLGWLLPTRYRGGVVWGVNGLLFFITLFAGYAILGGYFDAAATPPSTGIEG